MRKWLKYNFIAYLLSLFMMMAFCCNGQPVRGTLMLASSVTAVCPTGTASTLDPANIGTGLTLSGGNLTCDNTATAAWRSVFGTQSKTTGKYYLEYKSTNASGNMPIVGVGTTGASLTNYIGSNSSGWGYDGSGNYYNSGSASGSPPAETLNEVMRMAVDVDAHKIWWGNSSGWFGGGNPATGANPAFTGLSGTLFPILSEYLQETVTVNFGATAYAYTIPSAFCSWNGP